MNRALKPIQDYIGAVESDLASSIATEPSYYPHIKTLLEALDPGVAATPNPRRIQYGAPDLIVTRGGRRVGYVEAKEVGESLDTVERSEQLGRYLHLPNLLLTDFLEFRWYVDGQRRASARLGVIGPDRRIKRDKAGMEAVARLLADFLGHQAYEVLNSQDLAQRMARLAHMVRDHIIAAFPEEAERGQLHSWFKGFQDILIPDLRPDQFADMYAQTIAYGLFAARCTNDPPSPQAERGLEGEVFSRQSAAFLIPKTNPFLRRLFNEIAGPGLDDRVAWLVDELAELLALTDMEAILRDFGKGTAREDPVLHFYETFLKEYDPQVREMRGVYYTPEPVVSYIVRSIGHVLKTVFALPQGLADARVLLLDPAAGTATFLYAVAQEIYQAMVAQGQRGLWNDYAAERLLPRLFGFELLMAPYAVAHLKLGLLLQETGYRFQGDQRLGIYLTNTLEEAIHRAETLFAAWISEEANAAADIKREKPIMVVLGNPPYSGISANASIRVVTDLKTGKKRSERTWIGRLIEDYKVVDGHSLGEKNPKWLQDDYVKFIRFGQWRIERTGQGILAFITNHGYLDNPTFRGMRQSLMRTFDHIYILDLHGNVKKRERTPDGGKDENVFDIQQGVAIGIFVKEPGGQKEGITSLSTPSPRAERGPGGEVNGATVYHADLWGLREGKYRALSEADVASMPWVELQPASPSYLFVPVSGELEAEYEKGWPVNQVFPVNSVGIVTARDHFVLDLQEEALRQRIAAFRGSELRDEEVREWFRLKEKEGWNVAEARKAVRADQGWQAAFTRCLYRPFDTRPIFCHQALIERTRSEVMRHMLVGGNLGLVCPRRVEIAGPWQHVFVGPFVVEHVAVSLKTIDSLFPLYLYPEPEWQQGVLMPEAGRRPNLDPAFIAEVERRLGARFEPHPQSPSPQVERGSSPPSPFTEREPEGEVKNPEGEARGWRTPPELWARLKPLARQMRKEPTEAEELLWRSLRSRQLLGFKFRRQHSIERFIVDFYCPEASLVVEVEGPIHQYQGEEDQIRQAYLENQGLRVLCFSNEDVLGGLEEVLRRVSEALTAPAPWETQSSPSPLAERGPGGEVDKEPGGEVFAPEDIFHYAYAIFHSPTYRKRYAEFLKRDFPHLPLTSDLGLFRALVVKGAELVAMHLMESPTLESQQTMVRYEVDGSHLVDRVHYRAPQGDTPGHVYINKEQYFEGVAPEVWKFQVGGYQVLDKWLKDRKGRRLSLGERIHYQKIVVALRETIRFMAEIDALIPSWPLP